MDHFFSLKIFFEFDSILLMQMSQEDYPTTGLYLGKQKPLPCENCLQKIFRLITNMIPLQGQPEINTDLHVGIHLLQISENLLADLSRQRA